MLSSEMGRIRALSGSAMDRFFARSMASSTMGSSRPLAFSARPPTQTSLHGRPFRRSHDAFLPILTSQTRIWRFCECPSRYLCRSVFATSTQANRGLTCAPVQMEMAVAQLSQAPGNDRDVLAIFASEVSPEGASVMPDQMLLARLSHDRGATWGGITVVAPRQSGKRPGMPALVDIGKGCFIVFYEMCDNGHWGIYTVFSSNAGGSWERLHTKLFDSTPYSGSPWATLAWSSQGTPFIRAVWMTDSQAPGNGHPQLFSANLAVQYSPLNVTVAPHATGLYGYWPSVFQARQGTPVLTARSDGPVLAFLEDV